MIADRMSDIVDGGHPDGDNPEDGDEGPASALFSSGNGPSMAHWLDTPGYDEGPASEDHASDLGL